MFPLSTIPMQLSFKNPTPCQEYKYHVRVFFIDVCFKSYPKSLCSSKRVERKEKSLTDRSPGKVRGSIYRVKYWIFTIITQAFNFSDYFFHKEIWHTHWHKEQYSWKRKSIKIYHEMEWATFRCDIHKRPFCVPIFRLRTALQILLSKWKINRISEIKILMI